MYSYGYELSYERLQSYKSTKMWQKGVCGLLVFSQSNLYFA